MNTVRSFVAIELDAPVKRELQKIQDQLTAKVPGKVVRWVRPEGIHVTLKFLGDVPERQMDSIEAGLKRAARGSTPFSFTVRDIGCFPDTRRPSVIWIGLHEPSGALLHLQKAVEAQLTPLGYPPEERAFKPHLTLGRIDRGASLTDLRQIGEVIRTASVGELGTVRVTGISLMKSDLQPGGSVYTRLSWATLGATHEPAGG